MKEKIALYCRVSTRDQHTENQKIILIELAKKSNWDYEVFEEQESTRKTRPVKYKLLQMLRSRKYDGVCVLKLDRWARSTLELVNEVTEFYEKGIKFISHRENIDFSTSMGKLQLSIFSAFAQFERDLISERTLDGLARAALEGRKGGRPKGSKDSKPRRKSGYYLRHAGTKKR